MFLDEGRERSEHLGIQPRDPLEDTGLDRVDVGRAEHVDRQRHRRRRLPEARESGLDLGAIVGLAVVPADDHPAVSDPHPVGDADAAWYTAGSDNGWYAIRWPGQVKPLSVATSSRRNEVIDSYAP